MSNASLTSAIKRINDRLKQYELQGLTQTEDYYKLVNMFPTKTTKPKTKGGKTYTRLAIKPSQMSDAEKRLLERVGKKGARLTVGNTRDKLERGLKLKIGEEKINTLNRKQRDVLIKKFGQQELDLHKAIEDNKDIIYAIDSLNDAVKDSAKLDEDTARRILNLWSDEEVLKKINLETGEKKLSKEEFYEQQALGYIDKSMTFEEAVKKGIAYD